MTIGPGHFAVVSALIFFIGLGGVMTRRNAVAQIMALVVMFAAPVVAVAGFSQAQPGISVFGANTGGAVALVMLVALTVEAAVAIAVLLLLARRRHTLDLDAIEHLMG